MVGVASVLGCRLQGRGSGKEEKCFTDLPMIPPRAIEHQRRSRVTLAPIKVVLLFSFPPFLAECSLINPQPAHPP